MQCFVGYCMSTGPPLSWFSFSNLSDWIAGTHSLYHDVTFIQPSYRQITSLSLARLDTTRYPIATRSSRVEETTSMISLSYGIHLPTRSGPFDRIASIPLDAFCSITRPPTSGVSLVYREAARQRRDLSSTSLFSL